MNKVALVIVAGLLVMSGACSDPTPSTGTYQGKLARSNYRDREVAITQTKTLADACNIYETNNGARPPSLQDLTKPQPNGGKALLEPDAIIDPWGKLFQYDPSGSMNDGLKADIWTITPDGKKIGNWPRYRQ